MDDDHGHELAEKICELLNGHEVDIVIPALAGILVNAAVSVCSDKDVFMGYMKQVISEAYAEVDHSDEPIQ
jgi:hypothetical protein